MFNGFYLRQVYEEPLFNINDTNPRLYRKFRNLNDIRGLRYGMDNNVMREESSDQKKKI